MNLSIHKFGSHTVVKVHDENLDALIAPNLKSELVVMVENGERNILVDLFSCNSCDSSGLSALLLGNRLCKGANGAFIIYGISPQVRGMMDLIGFESLLTIAENKEAAQELLV